MTSRKKQFTDIDTRKEKKKLAKQLQETIRNCAKLTKNPKEQELILAFRDCLEWNDYSNAASLPYYNPRTPLASHKNKIECLLSALCFVILSWWNYLQGKQTASFIMQIINNINDYYSNGLEAYQITGDLVMGFRLKRKEE